MPVKRYDGSSWVTVAGDGAQGATGASASGANYKFVAPTELTSTVTTAPTATTNVDLKTAGTWYWTASATSNITVNFRGDGGTALSTLIGVGDAISVNLLITNGGTAYYPSAFQIDGVSVTPKWSGGTAPSAGNASAVDGYGFTIIKTAATPTYTVFGGGAVKFA